MAFFKAICAKNNQKVELIVQFNDIIQARENLHKQWYSIIDIQEVSELQSNSEVFYFDMDMWWWKTKTWQIQSNDWFKAYKKLVDDLHFNIIYIYNSKDSTEKEKILSTQKIKHAYDIFKKTKIETKKQEEIKKEDKKEDKKLWKEEKLPDFLLKELDYYYSLIDKVLEKISFILNNFSLNIDENKKLKLEQLLVALRQVKNITNVSKLKIIWETALIKIWELQSELISSNILEWKKELLNETNKLLKSFGSSRQIILPEDDIKLKFQNLLNEFIINFKDFFKWNKKNTIDKNSWKYYDILRELNIYKNKKKEINIQILKNYFNKTEKLRLQLKLKLVNQNIALIENRIKNKKISYSKTIKWFWYYYDILFYLFQKISDFIIYIVFIYSIFLILLKFLVNLLWISIEINYSFLLFILIFILFGFLLKISKNLFFLFIFWFLYIVSFIFLIINF